MNLRFVSLFSVWTEEKAFFALFVDLQPSEIKENPKTVSFPFRRQRSD